MTARAVMVLGCTSGAGKSWLATALCRWYANRGLRVAPFKAQNMSNHARVVALGDAHRDAVGEIGSAQYFQALAARARPQARMNPVLLKPEHDTRSQVIVMGRAQPALASMPWRERSDVLRRTAATALASLREDFDVIVIEGAGSPAEINLAASDYVNTDTALAASAACLLVADIDRGGAFAHLYGTHALMDDRVRARLRGFVLNKFRGDAQLLAPAPQRLHELTGVPTVAVLPMLHDHGLPEEDAVPHAGVGRAGPRVAVVCGPHASNLDEFEPLRDSAVSLSFSRDPDEVARADWLILPGSKHTRADLAWLRASGLAGSIGAHVAAGRPLLAVCGGLQLIGQRIDDPLGLEGGVGGSDAGLALLPLSTRFAAAKRLACSRHRFTSLDGPWAPLSGLEVEGYEIHQGRTEALSPALRVALPGVATAQVPASTSAAADIMPALGWQQGPVLAVYLHGLFENPAVTTALFGAGARPLDEVFDVLAGQVSAGFRPEFLMNLLEKQ